jgi:hypothetical protein
LHLFRKVWQITLLHCLVDLLLLQYVCMECDPWGRIKIFIFIKCNATMSLWGTALLC